MESTNPDSRPWTITKAEFDGWAAKLRRTNDLLWIGVVVPLIFACGTTLWMNSSLPFQLLMLALTGSTVWQITRNLLQARRMQAAAPEIWKSGGAICPRCLKSLDTGPCEHGLTAADREALRETWEAGVRGDVSGAIRVNALIVQRTPPGGFIPGLLRFRNRAVMAVMDPSKPLWRRLLSSILGFGVVMSILMLGVEWAQRGSAPPPLRIVMTTLQYGIGFGGMMIAGFAWSGIGAGRNRCKACNQIIAPGREAVPCAECGADLRSVGAVVSGERRRDVRTALIGAAIGLLGMLALDTAIAARLLPTRVLMLQYEFASPPTRWGVVQELERRQLDPDTTRAVAERLLEEASTSGRSSLAGGSFIGKALAGGTLGPDIAERVLRETTSIRLGAPRKARWGEPFVVHITPMFGTEFCQTTHAQLVIWEGVEVNGTLQPVPARWLGPTMTDPEMSMIKITLDHPGTHQLRVRAYAALVPIGTAPQGRLGPQLEPADQATARIEIIAETTILAE